MSKKEIVLSPSKIDQLSLCSWSYFCKYNLKLPDQDNDGSRRGSIVHGVLEHLSKPKHAKKLETIKEAGSPFKEKVVARYIQIFATKLSLKLDAEVLNKAKTGFETNRYLVDGMIMVGITFDFNPDESEKTLLEIYKNFEADEDGKKYKIRGIIDKVKVFNNGKKIVVTDYKTSKSKFDQKKINSNIQALVYQFFCHKLFPDAEDISFRFMFLRYPKQPYVEVPPLSKKYLDGFEHYLTYLQKYANSMDEIKAKGNLARYNGNHFICGKGGFKMRYNKETKQKEQTEEPNWKCPYKDPFDYWAIIDKDGNNIKTNFLKGELPEPDKSKGQKLVKRKYTGCPAFHASQQQIKNYWKILS